MSALRELQRDFLAVMLRRRDTGTLDRHLQRRGDVARRIGVYKTNTRVNFLTAIDVAFPVLSAQLGREEFRRMAWSYQRQHPSPSGNLFETGRALPQFLATALAGTAAQWLHDLARLEWLVQEAMTAADDNACFDPGALAGLAPELQGRLRLRLHPAVRLVALAYPCFDAWQAFQEGRKAGAPPAASTEHLLVRRCGEGIELHRLEAAAYAALAALATGETLAAAVDAASDITPDFETGSCLAQWAAGGVIIGVEIPGDAP